MPPDTHAILIEHVRMGRYSQAKDGLIRLVARRPDDVEARLALAECLFWSGQAGPAAFHLRQFIRRKDVRDEVLAHGCDLLARSGEKDLAVEILEARRAADPAAVNVRLALTSLYITAAKLDEARRVFGEAEVDFRDMPSVKGLKGALLSRLGDVDGAVAAYRACMWQNPDDPNLLSALGYLLNGSVKAAREEVYQVHAKFGEVMSQQAGAGGFDFSGRWDPERRLRVAFLTHDAIAHSVASFLEAPLRGLSREGFEVYLLHTGTGSDSNTERLAASPTSSGTCPE